jgi:hypothetical protein
VNRKYSAIAWIACVIFSTFPARAQTQPSPVNLRTERNDAVWWLTLMDKDAHGFTIFPRAEDRRFVFMSSSQGSDSNDGLTDDSPIRTIKAALKLMRNGYPDRLLLKRGDTFRAKNFNDVFSRGGRSVIEPMMIASYGDPHQPRPVIACNLALGGRNYPNFLVIQDLDFYADLLDPDSPTYDPQAKDSHQGEGINMLSPGHYMWIENCRFRDLGCALELQSRTDRYHGLVLRRCQIIDDFSNGSHSQGIYLFNVEDVLIEENLFDHDGWNDKVPGAGKTIFNHDMYIQHGNWGDDFNIVVRNNIIARASSHGCQLRPGGTLENNLFLKNPNSAFVAYSTSIMKNNVVLGSDNIGPGNARGQGLEVLNCPAVIVEDNIIAHKNDPVNNLSAFSYHPLLKEAPANQAIAEFRNNIVYDWTGPAFSARALGKSLWVHNNYFSTHGNFLITLDEFDPRCRFEHNYYVSEADQPFSIDKTQMTEQDWCAQTADTPNTVPIEFTDPNRDIATYAASIGLKDATLEGFLNAARQNERGHWDPRLTAPAVNDYIRAGFALKNPTTTK